MELILVLVISAGMVENNQNGVSRSLIVLDYLACQVNGFDFLYKYKQLTR